MTSDIKKEKRNHANSKLREWKHVVEMDGCVTVLWVSLNFETLYLNFETDCIAHDITIYHIFIFLVICSNQGVINKQVEKMSMGYPFSCRDICMRP
jgi:hypothetical protein